MKREKNNTENAKFEKTYYARISSVMSFIL